MKKILAVLLLLLSFTFITGCGEVQEEKTPEVNYEMTCLDLPDIEELLEGEAVLTQEAVYLLEKEAQQQKIVKRTFAELFWEPKLAGETVIELADGERVEAFQLTEEEAVLCVVLKQRDDGENLLRFLRKYDAAGTLLWEKEMTEVGDTFLKQLVVAEKKIYVLGQNTVYAFDESGNLLNRAELNYELMNGAGYADGKLMILCSSGNRAELVVLDESLKETERTKAEQTRFIPSCEGGLYVREQDEVTRQEQGAAATLFRLSDHQLDAYSLFSIHSVANGYVLLAQLQNPQLVFLTLESITWEKPESNGEETAQASEPQPQIPDEEKIQLTFAMLNYDLYSGDIVLFNKGSNEYHLNTKKYNDFSQYASLVGAAMTTEEAPDVIELLGGSLNNAYHNYIRNGYLEDMLPYVEGSDRITKADLVEKILELQSVDGKIYSIPTCFSLNCMAVSSSLVGEKTDWSIEEFLDFMETYPDALSLPGMSVADGKASMLQLILQGGMGAFYDAETGTAYFDGDEFRAVLKRINSLQISEGLTLSSEERAAEGEAVVWVFNLRKPRDLQQMEWKNGQELTLIGYPGAGGNRISLTGRLAMNANSDQKDGAWQFVEELLMKSPSVQKMTEFSVRKDLLEEYLYAEATPIYMTDDNGNEVLDENGQKIEIYSTFDGIPYYAITEEQIQKVRDAIDTGFMIDEVTQTIYTEVCEEAKPYFQGQKSLDDVVKVIQSRVQLYLDERN